MEIFFYISVHWIAVYLLYFYQPYSRGDNTFGSVRVCVCPSVCLWALSCLNPLTLIFGMRVHLDLG